MLLTVGNAFRTKMETYVSSDLKAAGAMLAKWNEIFFFLFLHYLYSRSEVDL